MTPLEAPAEFAANAPFGVGATPPADRNRQSALAALGRRAVTESDAGALLCDATMLLAETLDADFAGVTERKGGEPAMVLRVVPVQCEASTQPMTQRLSMAAGASLAAYTLSVGRPVVLADLRSETRFCDAALGELGISSAVCCPLMLGAQRFGAMLAASRAAGAFADADAELAESIASIVALSIGRQVSERHLTEQRQFSQTLLGTAESIVLLVNVEGRIVDMNAACEAVTGFTLREVLERPMGTALLAPEESAQIRGQLDRLRHGEPLVTFESFILTKQAERRRIAWRFASLRDDAGNVETLVGTGIDVTEWVEAQAELAQLRAQAAEAGQLPPAVQPQSDEMSAARRSAARSDDVGQAQAAVRKLLEQDGVNRRNNHRRIYPYIQAIAPMEGNQLPPLAAFRQVRCHDIAPGGFSYIAPAPPAVDTVIVALGSGRDRMFLRANVAHVTRLVRDGATRYLIGCNYTGRAPY